jgi:tetraacyldisaccharide 4'-kinase
VAMAAARCHATVLIGADATGAAAMLPPPVLRAGLCPGPEIAALVGCRVLAFAGIGRPEKFFAMLAAAGVIVAGTLPFADHHPYSATDLRRVMGEATRLGAVPVTTPKDAVRLPAAIRERIGVVGVSLAWDDPAALDALLRELR